MADNSKTIKTRIQNKTDTTVNFDEDKFIPLIGELLVYMDKDDNDKFKAPILKVGNGEDLPSALPSISGSGGGGFTLVTYDTNEEIK